MARPLLDDQEMADYTHNGPNTDDYWLYATQADRRARQREAERTATASAINDLRGRRRATFTQAPPIPWSINEWGDHILCPVCDEPMRNVDLLDTQTDIDFVYMAHFCTACPAYYHYDHPDVPLPDHHGYPQLCPEGDCGECDTLRAGDGPSSVVDTDAPSPSVESRVGEVEAGLAEVAEAGFQSLSTPSADSATRSVRPCRWSYGGMAFDLAPGDSYAVDSTFFDSIILRAEPWLISAWRRFVSQFHLEVERNDLNQLIRIRRPIRAETTTTG